MSPEKQANRPSVSPSLFRWMLLCGLLNVCLVSNYILHHSPPGSPDVPAVPVPADDETHNGFLNDAVVLSPNDPYYGPRYQALIAGIRGSVTAVDGAEDRLDRLAITISQKYSNDGNGRYFQAGGRVEALEALERGRGVGADYSVVAKYAIEQLKDELGLPESRVDLVAVSMVVNRLDSGSSEIVTHYAIGISDSRGVIIVDALIGRALPPDSYREVIRASYKDIGTIRNGEIFIDWFN